MITKKQISEWFSEWFNYFKGLDKEKKVKYFLALLLIIAGATYYIFNINIGSTQYNIQNNNGSNQITVQNSTFTNSPIVQSSSNVSFVYNTNPETNAETFSNQQSKTISVTVLANTLTGQTAHNLGFIPNVGRPNPESAYGINAYATSDIRNVTVTMDAPQAVDIIFSVPTSLT